LDAKLAFKVVPRDFAFSPFKAVTVRTTVFAAREHDFGGHTGFGSRDFAFGGLFFADNFVFDAAVGFPGIFQLDQSSFGAFAFVAFFDDRLFFAVGGFAFSRLPFKSFFTRFCSRRTAAVFPFAADLREAPAVFGRFRRRARCKERRRG
jgi:hypothetical protein